MIGSALPLILWEKVAGILRPSIGISIVRLAEMLEVTNATSSISSVTGSATFVGGIGVGESVNSGGNMVSGGQAYSPAETMVYGANLATDCNLGNVNIVTLTGNATLNNPTNLKAGSTYIWIIKQDGVGGRTLSYGSAFKFPSGVVPVLSTTLNYVDILTGVSDGTNVYAVLAKDFR